MRSRRERKVPERLEAGPATSKWSSGTAGSSAEKAPSPRSREAEKGAAQPAAKKNLSGHRKSPRPAATRAAATQAINKRGAAPANGDSVKKQRRPATRRTSQSAPNRSTPAPNDDEEAAAGGAQSMSGETDDEDHESDGHQQEDPEPAVDDVAATGAVAKNAKADQAGAEAKGSGKGSTSSGKSTETRQTTQAASIVEPADSENERDSGGRSSDSSEDSDANANARTSSDSEELDSSGLQKAKKPRIQPNPGEQGPAATAGVALKSSIGFLHHSRTASNEESLVAETSRPESSDSGTAPVPPARAPPRKLSGPASSIPTATAAPASAAAVRSAASAAQAARASAQTAQATTAAAAPNAVNDADKQREARAAAAVDALLRNPIQQRPWSKVEHARFLNAMHFYHRDWRRIAQHVGHNRTAADVRTHSQIWNSRSTAYGT